MSEPQQRRKRALEVAITLKDTVAAKRQHTIEKETAQNADETSPNSSGDGTSPNCSGDGTSPNSSGDEPGPNESITVPESAPYYPCLDASQPLCRQFVNQSRCQRGYKCRFYHPATITKIIQKKARREPGCCYCGAPQKRIINGRGYRIGEAEDTPVFFVICGRTGRSMRNCM